MISFHFDIASQIVCDCKQKITTWPEIGPTHHTLQDSNPKSKWKCHFFGRKKQTNEIKQPKNWIVCKTLRTTTVCVLLIVYPLDNHTPESILNIVLVTITILITWNICHCFGGATKCPFETMANDVGPHKRTL